MGIHKSDVLAIRSCMPVDNKALVAENKNSLLYNSQYIEY